MRNYEFNVNGSTLKRIDKKRARKAYNNGLTVLFCPVNINPLSPWRLAIPEHKALDGQAETFEKLCNAFEYYNCNNETGKYIAFYIPVAWFNRFSGERAKDYYGAGHYDDLQEYDQEFDWRL